MLFAELRARQCEQGPCRFLEDGTIEIDNHAAERAIRPIALDRKNRLFAGSNKGGERAAAILLRIETAKLNSFDPESYLRDILTRIADHLINRIDELLAWNVVHDNCTCSCYTGSAACQKVRVEHREPAHLTNASLPTA